MKKYEHIKKIFAMALITSVAQFCSNAPASVQNSAGYTAELSGTPSLIVGKNVFNIILKNNGNPAPGVILEVSPEMTMGSMVHGTPVDSVTDHGNGSYTVIAYMLMPGDMDSWTLHFHVNGQPIDSHIPITVTGFMMDQATFYGSSTNDLYVPDAMMPKTTAQRPYFVFKSAITGVVPDQILELYVSVRDNYMTHLPLATETTLTNSMGSVTVGSVLLNVHDANSTPISATPVTGKPGYYTVTFSAVNPAPAIGVPLNLDLNVTLGTVAEQKATSTAGGATTGMMYY